MSWDNSSPFHQIGLTRPSLLARRWRLHQWSDSSLPHVFCLIVRHVFRSVIRHVFRSVIRHVSLQVQASPLVSGVWFHLASGIMTGLPIFGACMFKQNPPSCVVQAYVFWGPLLAPEIWFNLILDILWWLCLRHPVFRFSRTDVIIIRSTGWGFPGTDVGFWLPRQSTFFR